MTVARFISHGDGYRAHDGTWYDSVVAVIQNGMLGQCMCGDAEVNLRYVRDGLRHIARLTDERPSGTDFLTWYRAWQPGWVMDGLALFGHVQARAFFFYWAEAQGFTEHGTSLPGWLTATGVQFLQTLNDVLDVP